MKIFNYLVITILAVALTGCGNNSFTRSGAGSLTFVDPGDNPGNPSNPHNPENPENPHNPPPGPHETTPITEHLAQSRSTKTDIVWVIDNSGSMAEEQQAIKDNASRFTQKLEADPTHPLVDYRLMVISSDASDDQDLKNKCSSYLTAATASQFGSCAILGVEGVDAGIPSSANQEEGIEAARRALDPNYVNGVINKDFLRDDADLQVIFVSDETDQPKPESWDQKASIGLITSLQLELEPYIADVGRSRDGREAYFPFTTLHKNFFTKLKSKNDKEFHAHAVVMKNLEGAEGACNHRYSSEEIGQRYIDFADMTSGSVSDICGNWSSTMDDLGLRASGLKSCFPLKHKPYDPTRIVAMVNNTLLPANSWTYKKADNEVCFNTIPPADAKIDIGYRY